MVFCRGRERGSRIAAPLLAVDRQYGELALRRAAQRAFHGARLLLGREAELLDLRALVLDQFARKLLLRVFQFGVDGPVFAGDKCGDFVFALAYHAQCRTLHASRRQAGPHLLPEQR